MARAGMSRLGRVLGKEAPREGVPYVDYKEGGVEAMTEKWCKRCCVMMSTLLPPVGVVLSGALGWWVGRYFLGFVG
jgi:hypothetical protein